MVIEYIAGETLARLMSAGLVVELESSESEEGLHRGRPRRYYRITRAGRAALESEAARLRHVVSLANRVLPEAQR